MEKIEVHVLPNAKEEKVSKIDGKLKVYLKAPALDGKANKALIESLANYFNLKKSCVKIIKGTKSRDKIVEICN